MNHKIDYISWKAQIKAALQAIRDVDNLPMPQIHVETDAQDESLAMPVERVRSVTDILEWLSSIFGFQVNDMWIL